MITFYHFYILFNLYYIFINWVFSITSTSTNNAKVNRVFSYAPTTPILPFSVICWIWKSKDCGVTKSRRSELLKHYKLQHSHFVHIQLVLVPLLPLRAICQEATLEKEVKKRNNGRIIREKMAKTFALRRQEIVEKQPRVEELQEQWPAMFQEEEVWIESLS